MGRREKLTATELSLWRQGSFLHLAAIEFAPDNECAFAKEVFMKTLVALVIVALLSLAVGSSFALAYFRGRPNQMAGQDWATRGYNAAAKEKRMKGLSCSSASAACIRRNGRSPQIVATCQSARASCMSTGTFVGVQGKVFPGLIKR